MDGSGGPRSKFCGSWCGRHFHRHGLSDLAGDEIIRSIFKARQRPVSRMGASKILKAQDGTVEALVLPPFYFFLILLKCFKMIIFGGLEGGNWICFFSFLFLLV